MKLKKGLVQIYTGCGKGKTTASLGLAIRAAGAGLRVYITQFIKGKDYSELCALKKIKNIKVKQCGRGCFITKRPKARDIKCARDGLKSVRKIINSGAYDVVMLDEINVALKLGLVNTKDVIEAIKNKPRTVELVLTGRYCPRALYRHADLVTEMREIKHPYQKGMQARRGIEY